MLARRKPEQLHGQKSVIRIAPHGEQFRISVSLIPPSRSFFRACNIHDRYLLRQESLQIKVGSVYHGIHVERCPLAFLPSEDTSRGLQSCSCATCLYASELSESLCILRIKNVDAPSCEGRSKRIMASAASCVCVPQDRRHGHRHWRSCDLSTSFSILTNVLWMLISLTRIYTCLYIYTYIYIY